jgi:hypothetical protein
MLQCEQATIPNTINNARLLVQEKIFTPLQDFQIQG